MGCHRCGRCCIDAHGTALIGGTRASDAWLRMPTGECRFLLPANRRGQRLCAIHKLPLRPEACNKFPDIPNAIIPPHCGRAGQVKTRLALAPSRLSPLPDV